jgi:hypothetical protein
MAAAEALAAASAPLTRDPIIQLKSNMQLFLSVLQCKYGARREGPNLDVLPELRSTLQPSEISLVAGIISGRVHSYRC